MAKRSSRPRPLDHTFFSPDKCCYTPERDGTLEQFLAAQFHGQVFRLFKGLDHFELLKEQGWLLPRMSVLRLMYNVGRDDEHYVVTEDFQLQGIPNAAHGAPPGIVNPAILLASAPPFEAHHLFGPAYEAMVARETGEGSA